MIRRALLLALAGVLLAAAPAPAASFNDIEDEVMCVSCNVPLNIAESPQAEQEREELRKLVADGLTKDQIKDRLVAIYGPNVLAEPEGKGFDVFAWIVPIGVALGLVALGVVLLPRWRRRRAAAGDPDEADATVLAAFAAGFVSFISPCVLPLVPGYLSAISGISLTDIRTREQGLARILLPATVFCLSFSVMFVALGMSATGLGSALNDNLGVLRKVAGGFMVAMGIFFVLTPFVPRLNREWRPEALMARAGSGGPVIAGLAFAIAWTPCTGPTLGAILAAAGASDTVGHGGVLLACYSLGLAVPFLLTAVAFDRMTGTFRWLRDHYLVVTAVSGFILVAMGVLLLSGELTRLNGQAQDLMNAVGLDQLL